MRWFHELRLSRHHNYASHEAIELEDGAKLDPVDNYEVLRRELRFLDAKNQRTASIKKVKIGRAHDGVGNLRHLLTSEEAIASAVHLYAWKTCERWSECDI